MCLDPLQDGGWTTTFGAFLVVTVHFSLKAKPHLVSIKMPGWGCEGLALNSSPSLVHLWPHNRLFLHGLHMTRGIICFHNLILCSNAAYQHIKLHLFCLPCCFEACTQQLSLKFLEILCNLSNSREHLGVQCIRKSNNSDNNNNNGKAMKTQGCCDFQHTVVFEEVCCNKEKPSSPGSNRFRGGLGDGLCK